MVGCGCACKGKKLKKGPVQEAIQMTLKGYYDCCLQLFTYICKCFKLIKQYRPTSEIEEF